MMKFIRFVTRFIAFVPFGFALIKPDSSRETWRKLQNHHNQAMRNELSTSQSGCNLNNVAVRKEWYMITLVPSFPFLAGIC